MIISNIHNRTPKTGILFTICTGDFFNHDLILRSIDLKSCATTIINCEPKLNQSVDTSVCERKEAPFSIYSWTIRIMCYVEV